MSSPNMHVCVCAPLPRGKVTHMCPFSQPPPCLPGGPELLSASIWVQMASGPRCTSSLIRSSPWKVSPHEKQHDQLTPPPPGLLLPGACAISLLLHPDAGLHSEAIAGASRGQEAPHPIPPPRPAPPPGQQISQVHSTVYHQDKYYANAVFLCSFTPNAAGDGAPPAL